MKKTEERLFFDVFRGLRPDLELTSVEESERPDFIAQCRGLRVGIEMTRVFFPSRNGRSSPQAVNAYREQLRRALSDEYARRRLPPAHVSVHLFAEEKLLDTGIRAALKNQIVEFVQDRIPPEGPHFSFEWPDFPGKLTDLGVHRIAILRHKSLTKAFWSMPYSACVPESRAAYVQDIIASKTSLAKDYRTRVQLLWLLIVSGTEGLHSIVDFENDVLTASYSSPFDRIFLLRTFGSTVLELNQVVGSD